MWVGLRYSVRARAIVVPDLAGAAVVQAYLQTPCNRRKLAVYRKEIDDLLCHGQELLPDTNGARQCLYDAGQSIPCAGPGRHERAA